jgi:hypothetical protein
VLVVLDDARDVRQVRPLLPGGAGCLVLVTGRTQDTSLVAAVGAHPLNLDPFSPEEARELLVRRIGRARAAAEPGAVSALIEGCRRLPAALTVVAARAATHPHTPLAALIPQHEASSRVQA